MADLLTHTPSPEPQRYEKKTEQNNLDSVDGNKTRDRKGIIIIVHTLCKRNFIRWSQNENQLKIRRNFAELLSIKWNFNAMNFRSHRTGCIFIHYKSSALLILPQEKKLFLLKARKRIGVTRPCHQQFRKLMSSKRPPLLTIMTGFYVSTLIQTTPLPSENPLKRSPISNG